MKMLATCGSDIKLFRWATCELLATCQHPGLTNPSYFRNISWCCKGEKLAAVPSTGYPLVIVPTFVNDLKQQIRFSEIQVPQANVLSFSKIDGNNIVIGCETGHLFSFNIEDSGTNKLHKFPSGIEFISQEVSDCSIAIGCKSGQIYVMNSLDQAFTLFRVPDSKTLTAMQYHPKERNTLAAGSHEGVVAIWDSNASLNRFITNDHTSTVTDISFCCSDWLFGTVALDKFMYIYDTRIKESVFKSQLPYPLTAIAFPNHGNQFVIGTATGHVYCYDKRRLPNPKLVFQAHQSIVRQFAFQDENYSEEPMVQPVKSCPSGLLVQETGQSPPQSEITDEQSVNKPLELFWNEPQPSQTTFPSVYEDNRPLKKTKVYPLSVLKTIQKEIIKASKEAISIFAKQMNDEFLKLRMSVNKNFAILENKNEIRWNHFHSVLYQIGDTLDKSVVSEKTGMSDRNTLNSRNILSEGNILSDANFLTEKNALNSKISFNEKNIFNEKNVFSDRNLFNDRSIISAGNSVYSESKTAFMELKTSVTGEQRRAKSQSATIR